MARVRHGRKIFLGVIVVATIGVFALPTVVLLGIGMIPSIVALIVDTHRHRYLSMTIASLNFAGVMVLGMDLWSDGNTMALAIDLAADPLNLAIMYTPAAAGWLLWFGIPPLIAAYVEYQARDQIEKLEKVRTDLVEEWGEQVKGGPA